jgi:hypothetical protein
VRRRSKIRRRAVIEITRPEVAYRDPTAWLGM